jgi:2-hydroxychromene-2-carboxylate isomerase
VVESTESGTLRFCFDYVSPYAYLAWARIHDLAERHRCLVIPVPVVFGALLDAHGQKGPAEIPAKRRYLIKDCARLAHAFGVPFAPPPSHPFNPLLALRASSLPMPEGARRTLIDRLYAEAWGGGRGVTDPAVVAEAASAAGLDGDAAVQEAREQATKDLLRRQTDEALARGAFGVPTVFAGDELFWGVDALGHLERFLDGADPVTPELLERWVNLPSSAVRRGAGSG